MNAFGLKTKTMFGSTVYFVQPTTLRQISSMWAQLEIISKNLASKVSIHKLKQRIAKLEMKISNIDQAAYYWWWRIIKLEMKITDDEII